MVSPKKSHDGHQMVLSLSHMHLIYVSLGHCSMRFKAGHVISNLLSFLARTPSC